MRPEPGEDLAHRRLIGAENIGHSRQAPQFEQKAHGLEMPEADFAIIHIWNSIHAIIRMDQLSARRNLEVNSFWKATAWEGNRLAAAIAVMRCTAQYEIGEASLLAAGCHAFDR